MRSLRHMLIRLVHRKSQKRSGRSDFIKYYILLYYKSFTPGATSAIQLSLKGVVNGKLYRCN